MVIDCTFKPISHPSNQRQISYKPNDIHYAFINIVKIVYIPHIRNFSSSGWFIVSQSLVIFQHVSEAAKATWKDIWLLKCQKNSISHFIARSFICKV